MASTSRTIYVYSIGNSAADDIGAAEVPQGSSTLPVRTTLQAVGRDQTLILRIRVGRRLQRIQRVGLR
jgi:hypothetical protein